MGYNFGNPCNWAAEVPFRLKNGLITDPNQFDTALPNDYQFFSVNPDGDGKVQYLIAVDSDGVTQLNNPAGVEAYTLSTVQLSTPATPTVAVEGTAGSTSISYKVVAWNGFGVTLGHTPASAAGSTSTANATLSTTNYTTVTWDAVEGAQYYSIFRTAAGGTPSSTGEIGTVVATIDPSTGEQTATYSFSDTGIAGDSTTAPTTNTTGAVSFPVLAGSITIPVLGTPAGLAVAVNGTAGSTTVGYKIVALAQLGHSAASSEKTTATAAATLTSVNSLTVTWDPVSGATGYQVYRTTAAGTPSSTGLIGTTDGETFTFTDTGLAGDSSTAPTTNTTGAISLSRIDDTSGNTAINISPTASAVNYITVTNAATANDPSITAAGSDTNIGLNLIVKGSGVLGLANTLTTGVTATVAGQATAGSAADVVNIATGNAASTASKTVNIATGTPNTNGNNKVQIGGTVASAKVTFKATVSSWQATNYVAAGGSNNAITVSLADAAGTNVALAAGLTLVVSMGALTLQAGANSLNLNGGGAVAIKKASAPTVDLATAIAANGIITVCYNGTSWLQIGA